MAINYVELAEEVRVLIDENGRDVTLTTPSETPADSNNPEEGPNPASATTLGPVKAVITDYDEEAVDGTMVMRGDKTVMIAYTALSVDLTFITFINDGAYRYRVVNVNPIHPGPTPIAYEFQARR